MELRHLRYFVTTAELGSVTRAAEKLFMAQPPLSAQLRQLEEEVGVPLLQRLPRGVRLTVAGESFLRDARAILARTQEAATRARETQAGAGAVLRLGMVPSSLHVLLPGFLQRLRALEGGAAIRVQAREMITSQQMQGLRNDEIDLGFARPGSALVRQPGAPQPQLLAVIDDPFCLALPADHTLAKNRAPIALKQAAQAQFVAFARHRMADYFDRTAALCEEAGFTPDIRHEASQFSSVLALVACGLGVAIVPASLAIQAPEGIVFRRLLASRDQSRLAILGRAANAAEPWLVQALQVATKELSALGKRLKALPNLVENKR
jgi:DNA-binding transcriptional LysR family regulator